MTRPERAVAVLLVVSIVAGVGLAVVYLQGGDAQWEGALLAAALGALAAALVLWANVLYPHEEVTQDRPVFRAPAERERFVAALERGPAGVGRRRFLVGLLGGSFGALLLAALFPVRSLGPGTGSTLRTTAWRRGVRLSSGGDPVRADALGIGGVLTVFPEGSEGREDSAVVLVRVRPDDLDRERTNADWVVAGNLAYSKICTHVGCPVGLYQESNQTLLCPCHQSTFAVLEGARPVLGPATRSLPQLPLGVDDEGYLIAVGDFAEPVGPAFWNRDR